MWDGLYVHQREHGMLADLPDDAFDSWVKSIASINGRFGFVLVATADGRDAGFCAGRMRPMPAYYGGGYAGYISDVFVIPELRGVGVGRLLVDAGVQWFRDRDVKRVELHVVWGNTQALDFYRRLGWTEDIVQMVSIK